MLIINVGIFLKWFVNFSVNTVAVRANSKLQFFFILVQQSTESFPEQLLQNKQMLGFLPYASFHFS